MLLGKCSWCGTPMDADEANSKPCDRCFAAWPKCAVPACQNKCCLRLKSIYCWPHTPGVDADEAASGLEGDEAEDDTGEDTNVEDSYAR